MDYFSLRAYDMGMEVSVGAPTIAAGAILVPTAAGVALGEGISGAEDVGYRPDRRRRLVSARFST